MKKSKKGKLALLMVALLGILFFAKESFTKDPSLLVVFDQSNKPLMFDYDGNAVGIYPDIITKALERAGIPHTMQAVSWRRALASVESGKAAIGGLYKTKEREQNLDFSDPIYEETLLVYVNKSKPFAFNSYEDLTGKTIGVVRGWSYGDAFDRQKLLGRFYVEEAESDEINALKLALGRIDAALIIPVAAQMNIQNKGLQDKIYSLPNPITINKTYFAIHKQHEGKHIIEKFNKALKEMKADGSYDVIAKGLYKVRD